MFIIHGNNFEGVGQTLEQATAFFVMHVSEYHVEFEKDFSGLEDAYYHDVDAGLDIDLDAKQKALIENEIIERIDTLNKDLEYDALHVREVSSLEATGRV